MKLFFSSIFIILSLNFIFSNDLSQDIKVLNLSLNESIGKALKNNLLLNKERLIFEDKKIDYYTVFNKFYPDLNVSGSLGIKEESGSFNFSLASSSNFNARMIFEILDAKYSYLIGKTSYDQAKKLLEKNVKKLYFKLVLQKKEITAKEKLLENAKNRFNKSAIQFKQGEISELDKLNEELTYKTIIPEITKLENDLRNNCNQFSLLIGLDSGVRINLTDEIPKIDAAQIEDINSSKNLLDDNYDLKTLKIKIEKEKNSNNILISSLTPTFRVAYSLSLATAKNIFKDNFEFNPEKDWSDSQNLSFSVSLPIHSAFPFSSNQTGIIKQNSVLKRASLDLANETKKKQIEFLNLILTLKQIGESFEILNFNFKLSEKILKLTENGFYEGSKNFLDVKDAEKNLLDANLKLERAYYEYYENYIELISLLNKPE